MLKALLQGWCPTKFSFRLTSLLYDMNPIIADHFTDKFSQEQTTLHPKRESSFTSILGIPEDAILSMAVRLEVELCYFQFATLSHNLLWNSIRQSFTRERKNNRVVCIFLLLYFNQLLVFLTSVFVNSAVSIRSDLLELD